VRAYKFLADGGVGPFSGYPWPLPTHEEPGAWVAPSMDAPPPFRDAVWACSVEQLAYWVNAELWEAELADPVTLGERVVAASRGRLVGRVDTWGPKIAEEFLAACRERAQGHASAADHHEVTVYSRSAERLAERGPAITAYTAAHTARVRSQVMGDGSFDVGRRAERLWQSAWLAERLGVEAG